MANSDDPPFLNVGTEVSAKYKGAFCEATIKIAKKLVKCKVSYTKGQTTIVSNDLIKGPLKVGAQVEVRQPDGQYLTAAILKLTDASTYTVVFDDGDERTLRRSYLCLKGGRHYSESESLDQMPLTDPENFGTPVLSQTTRRPGRRRRRPSQSSSPEDNSHHTAPPPAKKPCYPAEFPVGRCVFLENDRRRAGWLPAVVVPTHFVMEQSEVTDDTICIRSFKDGRFYAVRTNELHTFAPDKEPLVSMLEGDIPAMYMCKPAIERAMAYMDTGELPWNMDLFDTKKEVKQPLENGDTDDEVVSEELKMEKDAFYERYKKFQEDKGTPMIRQPTLAQRDLDLFRLYHLVKDNGGMDKVTQELKWRSLYLQLGMPAYPTASHLIRQAYKRYLYGFEVAEKARMEGKPTSKSGRKKSVQAAQPDPKQPPEPPVQPEPTVEPEPTMQPEPMAEPEPAVQAEPVVHPEPAMQPDPVPQPDSDSESDRPVKTEEPKKETPSLPKEEPPRSAASAGNCSMAESVQESDMESSQAEESPGIDDADGLSKAGTSDKEEKNNDKDKDGMSEEEIDSPVDGGSSSAPYQAGTRIRVFYGKGKTLQMYEAKILECEQSGVGRQIYYIHYNGWNNRYDEWIDEDRIAGKSSSPGKGTMRPAYGKKQPPGKKPRGKKSLTPSKPAGSTKAKEGDGLCHISSPDPIANDIKTPAKGSAGAKKRRRTSSMTEQSGSEAAKSPDSLRNGPNTPASFTTSLSKQSSMDCLIPLSPPMSSRVPPILSPDGQHDTLPLRVQPESSSTSDASSEEEQGILVKKEENLNWMGSAEEASPPPPPPPPPPSSVSQVDASVTSSPVQARKPVSSVKLAKVPLLVLSPSRKTSCPPSPCPPATPIVVVSSPQSSIVCSSSAATSPTHSYTTTSTTLVSSSSTLTSPTTTTTSTTGSNNTPLLETPVTGLLLSPVADPSDDNSHSSLEDSPLRVQQAPAPPVEEKQASPTKKQQRAKRKRQETSSSSSSSDDTNGVENGSSSDPEAKRLHRDDLDFSIDSSTLQELNTHERITLIQSHMKALQQKYMELKAEVSYLDRKRRRARRKEREAARSHLVHQQPQAIECH